MDEKIMNKSQVAEMLGVSQRCIEEWAKSGKLPCSRFAGARKQFWLLSSVLQKLKDGEGNQLKYKPRGQKENVSQSEKES